MALVNSREEELFTLRPSANCCDKFPLTTPTCYQQLNYAQQLRSFDESYRREWIPSVKLVGEQSVMENQFRF